MAKKRIHLHEDPRWLPFCAEYAGDIVRFAVENIARIGTSACHGRHCESLIPRYSNGFPVEEWGHLFKGHSKF